MVCTWDSQGNFIWPAGGVCVNMPGVSGQAIGYAYWISYNLVNTTTMQPYTIMVMLNCETGEPPDYPVCAILPLALQFSTIVTSVTLHAVPYICLGDADCCSGIDVCTDPFPFPHA